MLGKPLQALGNLLVAQFELCLIGVVHGQRLRQGKHMLGLVVAHQGALDGVSARLAAGVAQGGQLRRVALAGDNGPDDPHARGPGDVGDHMVQLQIHVGERLLHVLDMRRSVVEMPLPQPQIAA
ncbi:hypothetical protein D9M69_585510 [compost metagenome]